MKDKIESNESLHSVVETVAGAVTQLAQHNKKGLWLPVAPAGEI